MKKFKLQIVEHSECRKNDQLTTTVKAIPRGDTQIIMDSLNEKIGSDNESYEHFMGKRGLGEKNGELLLNFPNEINMVIGGYLFKYKYNHKATWLSPDKNKIDHIRIGRMWRSNLLNVKVQRSADNGSYHNLLIALIRP